ncbi:MAG: GNAT family N-acetyltransferase [Anaerolineaceae bacterium]|nr:GNAT family N-acetyltransferase [Anaerolineaceae bacterium]
MTQAIPTPPGRLKAYEPAQDAEAVIRLIEDSFNLKNDPESVSVIQQMRLAAQRQQQSGWLSGGGYGQPGYVWMVGDRIVGNINIISFLDRLRHIALIANVAVIPEFQHLGIARAMTKHALRYAQQKRAAEIWLQVDSNNLAARNLYEGLDFRTVRSVNNWVLDPAETKKRALQICDEARLTLSSRRPGDWGKQKTWLEMAYPSDTRWYAPVNFSKFSPWAWLNPFNWDSSGYLTHFAVRMKRELTGVLSWQRGMTKSDYLWLALPQDQREATSLNCLLGGFLINEWSGRTTRLEYPAGRAEATFIKLGFRLNRRLDWMKLRN